MTKPGHKQPNLDNADQDTLFSSAPIPSVEVETQAMIDARSEAEISGFAIPQRALLELDESVAAARRVMDRRDPQGFRNGYQARQEIGGVALTGEQIVENEKRENRQARARATAAGGTHPTGRRGKKYTVDDNSPSVRSAYEGFGQ
ncbi:MAG: hypothetical protein JWO96_813 [Candidatus Saccharibacteria bacterium]|nr:hypothetical protein [Candidatus Saccharibacteria bacterium]